MKAATANCLAAAVTAGAALLSSTAMVQAQDVLSLGSEARMNTPGTAATWSWQLAPGMLTAELAARLRESTAETGRLG